MGAIEGIVAPTSADAREQGEVLASEGPPVRGAAADMVALAVIEVVWVTLLGFGVFQVVQLFS
jgi:hypothetical protein